MKRKFLFAIVAFTASLAAMADDDTRIEISEIVATSNTSEIPVYGANIIQPTVTVIQGLPARFGIDSGNGWWHKKVDNEWRDVRSGSFTSGTWRFVCQVRIDGEGGKTHKFAKTVTTTVDGTIWGVDNNPSIFDTFCWTWVTSPDYVISEDAGIISTSSSPQLSSPRTVYNLSGQRVGNDYKGIVIDKGRKIVR